MSILERLVDNSQRDTSDDDRTVDLTAVEPLPEVRDDAGPEPQREAEPELPAGDEPEPQRSHQPVGVRGMRIRRVRLRSVATIAAVFFALGYITIVGTVVIVWNAMRALGFVESFEETVTTALGLEERFTVVGSDLFGLLLVGTGVLMLVGLLLTVLLALVYNVTCALFGGLAVETGPLRRRHRVFSWRHRRFVTIRH